LPEIRYEGTLSRQELVDFARSQVKESATAANEAYAASETPGMIQDDKDALYYAQAVNFGKQMAFRTVLDWAARHVVDYRNESPEKERD
jgi:hypothetical protein